MTSVMTMGTGGLGEAGCWGLLGEAGGDLACDWLLNLVCYWMTGSSDGVMLLVGQCRILLVNCIFVFGGKNAL